MTNSLQPDLLLRSVGKSISNRQGDRLGCVAEITRDTAQKQIEYIILKSDVCFGRGRRFFAVPASSRFIEITRVGTVIFKLGIDDLQFANGISANECPKPTFNGGESIFELYNYRDPAEEAGQKTIPN